MTKIRMWDNIPGPTEGAEPSLEYYAPDPSSAKDAAVVIFPGGAYTHLAEHEGKGYADFLAAAGYHAFVCKYSQEMTVPNEIEDAKHVYAYVRDLRFLII